jgi:hypothetical protein
VRKTEQSCGVERATENKAGSNVDEHWLSVWLSREAAVGYFVRAAHRLTARPQG